MQQPLRKRHRVDITGDTLDSDNTISINERRAAPKQRISRACDRCRSRRAKCDGSQPTCVMCAAADVPCTYGSHTKKRGLPTGYVRLLENLWGLAFASIPGAEDAAMQLLRTATVVVGDAGVTPLPKTKDQTRDNDQLLPNETFQQSKVREAIDARVMKINAAVGDGGDSEGTSKCRVVWEGIPLPTGHRIESWNVLLPPTQVSESLPCVDSNMTVKVSPTSAHIELPDDVWAQIGSYLDYCYCWLPVVPKHDIVRLLSRRQDGSSCTSSEMAVLWSCLAVASSLGAEPDQRLVTVYHSAAVKQLDNDNKETSTHHVTAIFLLGLSRMELYHWKDAYLLIGRAARLVHYLYNTTVQPDPALSRVYLGIFVIDTLLSFYLGVPISLSTHHIMLTLSVHEFDGPEEWDPGPWDVSGTGRRQCPVRVMSIFAQLVRLMIVLNNAIAPQLLPASPDDTLSEWLDQLPRHCSLKEGSDTLTPPLANLSMVYQSVKSYVSGRLTTENDVGCARIMSSGTEYTRMFGTFTSKSMLHICQKLSTSSTQRSVHKRVGQSVPVPHKDTTAGAGIVWDPFHPFIDQADEAMRDSQYCINDGVPDIPPRPPGQSRTTSVQCPTSFSINDALDQPYSHSDGTLCQDLDDTETMQTILDDMLAQETDNEPFFSNFMQDLGFFDEDMLPPI
jgi:hypothetical protein